MANKRISKTVVKAVTAEKMNESLTAFAKADAREQVINAEMDAAITHIREQYQDELDKLKVQKDSAYEVVQVYCDENKDKLFVKARSIDTVHGKIGFRTGTPALKLKKGIKWAVVLDNLKQYLPDYVRKIEEPAKDRLLADRMTPAVAENLSKVGLMVEQDERFFIELKKEDTVSI